MIRVFNNITIADRNSFHIAVTARELIEYSSSSDLVALFADPVTRPDEWYVISGGNNILFTEDITTTLLSPTATDITIIDDNDHHTTLRVEAGAEWDDVVEWCVEREIWGIENLSLIPGKAGAAPIQNIGAYGVEACDSIVEVEYFDPATLTTKRLTKEECNFGYRDSIFKRELRGKVIVTAIIIRLSRVASPRLNYADVQQRVEARGGASLRNIRDVICEIRNEKLPDTAILGNAGSFFKNPIVESTLAEKLRESYPTMPIYRIEGDPTKCKLAAGWLIDQAGMKGYRSGNVGVHDRQALVLVNYGGATGREVVALSKMVQQRVMKSFGVEIDSEVNIL